VDESRPVDRDADVGRAATARVEEEEVTGLELVDSRSAARLLLDRSRHPYALLRENVLDEATAIEAVGVGTAVAVAGADEVQGG
jgi:hypothetical protein